MRVTVLGYEYSVYGGIDGHYCGTKLTPNKEYELQDLPEKYNDIRVDFFERRDRSIKISFWEDKPYLYFAPELYRSIKSIEISEKEFDNIIFKLLGWKEYEKGKFEEYYAAKSKLLGGSVSLGELKEMLS